MAKNKPEVDETPYEGPRDDVPFHNDGVQDDFEDGDQE